MYKVKRIIYINSFFFFNDTATTEIYTLSLHDALPISRPSSSVNGRERVTRAHQGAVYEAGSERSEEHTSELQSPCNLVCRLLLEKKKTEKTRKRVTIAIHTGSCYNSIADNIGLIFKMD